MIWIETDEEIKHWKTERYYGPKLPCDHVYLIFYEMQDVQSIWFELIYYIVNP